MKLFRPVYLGYFVAVLFGFFAFFPLSPVKDAFALIMAVAASNLLLIVAFNFDDKMSDFLKITPKVFVLPLFFAFALYGFCWIAYTYVLFSRGPIDFELYELYAMAEQFEGWFIILFLIIVAAEELFWRGFAQHRLSLMYGDKAAILMNAAVYTLAVVFSLNPYLIAAALFSSIVFGLLFAKFKNLYIVVLSHIIWDILILKILPLV